jgi:hypothetical protein
MSLDNSSLEVLPSNCNMERLLKLFKEIDTLTAPTETTLSIEGNYKAGYYNFFKDLTRRIKYFISLV